MLSSGAFDFPAVQSLDDRGDDSLLVAGADGVDALLVGERQAEGRRVHAQLDVPDAGPRKDPNPISATYDPTTGGYSWRLAIAPYVKNWQLHVCPSQKSLNGTTECAGGGNNTHVHMGYAYNMTPHGGGRPDGTEDGRMADPAGTVALGDGTGLCCRGWRCCPNLPTPWTDYDPREAIVNHYSARHNDGTNYLWYDGHVKWVTEGGLGLADLTIYQKEF